MNSPEASHPAGSCANCGRTIKSGQNELRGRRKTLCAQCYRELAYGDLQAKNAEFQGRG